MYKIRKGLNVYRDSSTIVYMLYNTMILAVGENYFRLKTAGWKTNHTKNCINDNIPDGYKVYQKNYEWYVSTPYGIDIEFEEEMVLEVY